MAIAPAPKTNEFAHKNAKLQENEMVKRGYYEATFELMAKKPKEVPNYDISDDFLRRVEKQILEAPEFYLWTHKRWKHREK